MLVRVEYNTRNNNSTATYTLLSGLNTTLSFNIANVKNIEDYDLSTFKYTVTRDYTTSQQYDLYNQSSSSWEDIVLKDIEQDIIIEIVASKGAVTYIKVTTDKRIKVADTQSGNVIVEPPSRTGTFKTTYANNMNFNLQVTFPDYSLYSKMNYKISQTSNYVSNLIMQGSVDITDSQHVFYITSGYSSGNNTIGINQTSVGTYQITLSTVTKVETIGVALWVIPFPQEYYTRHRTVTQIQLYHGDNLTTGETWADSTLIYQLQLSDDESARKKINKISLRLKKGIGNYANDFIVNKIRIGTTSNNGTEYSKTNEDSTWVYFEATDITVNTALGKLYINILNTNAARLTKLWVGQENDYENYIEENSVPSTIKFSIATIYNLDNNSVITPTSTATGVVNVNASQDSKTRFRFKAVASTYDTTEDITDYEPKVFMRNVSAKKPYNYTNITVQGNGSFNSGDELTISADNLSTWP